MKTTTLSRILLLPGLLVASVASAQFFFPPGALNPGADIDSLDDVMPTHAIARDGTLHAVWFSQRDYTGTSGGDPDLFYSFLAPGQPWSPVELVNLYGTLDGVADERNARLVVGRDGIVHCVWQSEHPVDGSGTDPDIFYSRRTGAGWQSAESVNDASGDNSSIPNDDTNPALALRGNGDVVVTWQTNALWGADEDLAFRVRTSSGWGAIDSVHDALGDTGDDLGPVAMATSPDGDVIAVWSTDEDFGGLFPTGPDRDIVWSELSGLSGWTPMLEVAELARLDSGDDRDPAVAVWGRGFDREIHVVWVSTEDYDFPFFGPTGTDPDIFHTLIPALQILPPANRTYPVHSNADNDGGAPDRKPSICLESGGTIHVVWESEAEAIPGIGTDADVLHVVKGETWGLYWSPVALLGFNALFDQAGEEDRQPEVRCGAEGLLSGLWQSRDDLGNPSGPLGSDFDLFHAIGFGPGFVRPEPVGGDFRTNWDIYPRLDAGPDGSLHLIWASGLQTVGGQAVGTDRDIVSAQWTPDGWTVPELVNLNAPGDGTLEDFPQDLAVDASGTIHAIWFSYDNIGGTVGTDLDLFYSRKPAGGSFGPPELVDLGGTTDGQGPLDFDDSDARIAVSPTGIPHVVWVDDYGVVGQPGKGTVTWASRDGSGWSPPEVVHPAAGNGVSSFPDIAMEGEDPVVVWGSAGNFNGTGTDEDVYVARRFAGTWTPPTPLGPAGIDAATDRTPTLAIQGDGTIHVVWSSDLVGPDVDLYHSAWTGSAWSPAVQLLESFATDSGDDYAPRIALAQSGLRVGWTTSEPLHFGLAGTDGDIAVAAIDDPGTLPAPVLPRLANAHALEDSAPIGDLTIVLDRSDDLWVSWSTTAPLDDPSVFLASIDRRGAIFADGFEGGDASRWSTPP